MFVCRDVFDFGGEKCVLCSVNCGNVSRARFAFFECNQFELRIYNAPMRRLRKHNFERRTGLLLLLLKLAVVWLLRGWG